MDTPLTTIIDAERLNLTHEEFSLIQQIIGRVPNELELEIFARLWTDHACYKNSLKWLELLPKTGEKVIVPAGKENAGAIDIGNGLACVFKVESHNHPCAVQPRLGASIGLRVVTRDIVSMGATPLATLNSLRFGEATSDTSKWLFNETIEGIADFKKGFDIPVIGGEVCFDKGYNSNPIVNNMVVGVVKKENLILGHASGEGNLIAILGAETGNDGIDNDSFAADLIPTLETKSISIEELRDLSIEKDIFNAIQTILADKLIDGLQTIGAQGLIGATTEMAARGNSGINLNLNKVPCKDELNEREILFSETWGRVLLCFKPRHTDELKAIAAAHNLSFAIIGEVCPETELNCIYNDKKIAEIPVLYVGLGGNAPKYERSYSEPIKHYKPIEIESLTEPDHYPNVVKKLMKNLNIASKKWLFDKFDESLSEDNINIQYPSDAALIKIEGSNQSLVATMDCNPSYMQADPYIGVQIAIAEASRNIICAGGKPLAISDCLNYGNPMDPEVYWQFVASIRGISKACDTFKTPVTSGNVSFYNQLSLEGKMVPIIPTPTIGMIGIIEDTSHHTTLSFKHKGDTIFLIGKSQNDINGSEYLRAIHGIAPHCTPIYHEQEEVAVQNITAMLIQKGLVRSVHDVSNGGLFFTLLESSIPLGFGFDITTDAEIRKDAFLFGESQSRVVVSIAPSKQDDFVDFMVEQNISFSLLGHVTKGELRIDDESYGFIDELKEKYEKILKQWAEIK